MKILFTDLLCPKGHMDTNKYFVETLSNMRYKIDILWQEHYMKKEVTKWIANETVTRFFGIRDSLYRYSNKLDIRTKNLVKLRTLQKHLTENEYDFCYISSFETVSMGFINKFKLPVILHAHNNIEEIRNSTVKRVIFMRLHKKNIALLTYEPFMKEYLESIGFVGNSFCLRHPIDKSKIDEVSLPLEDKELSEFVTNSNRLVFGPSLSNDEELLENLKTIPNSATIKSKLLIRTKRAEYKSDNIFLYNRRLSSGDYSTLFSIASAILLALPKDYFRTSGVLFDSFAFEKPCIIPSNSPSLTYYSDTYPDVFFSYENFQSLMSIINTSCFTVNTNYFKGIDEKYSERNLRIDFSDVIQRLKLNRVTDFSGNS